MFLQGCAIKGKRKIDEVGIERVGSREMMGRGGVCLGGEEKSDRVR